MPTDDDYGRRERLLLHQHPTGQYGQPIPASPIHGSTASNSTTGIQANAYTTTGVDCYHKHQASSGAAHSCITQDQHRSSSQSNDQLQHQYGSTNIGRQICQSVSQSLPGDHRFARYSESSIGNSEQTKQSSSTGCSTTLDYRSYQPLPSITERSHQPQHPQKQNNNSSNNEYANSSVLVAVSAGSNPFSVETFPSPPSPAPVSDRFVPPPPLSPSASEKYASSQSLANYPAVDRLLPTGSASARDLYGATPPSPISAKEQRFASAERLLATTGTTSGTSTVLSSVGETKDQQRYSASSTERLLSSASPVLGVLSAAERCAYGSSSLKDVCGSSSATRYSGCSTERLLSSSPIHAPVPERFAGTGIKSSEYSNSYIKDSPLHERYHNHQTAAQQQQHHHDRFVSLGCTMEKYLPNSPNTEAPHQRCSSSERILGPTSGNNDQTNKKLSTDRAVEAACHKYSDNTRASVTIQGYQDNAGGSSAQRHVSTSDRFNDLAMQRYAQSRPTDRFSNGTERYLPNNISITHDARQIGGEIARYSSSSSTERLLSSSSCPSSIEAANRVAHHQTYNLGNNSVSTQSTSICEQSRYVTLSPTSDGANPSGHAVSCYSQQSSKQSAGDKYHHQLTKPAQCYSANSSECGSYDHLTSNHGDHQFVEGSDRYGMDRFTVGNGIGEARFQTTGSNNRYHCTTIERLSSTCGNTDKYLSLPKPKDRYIGGGRIANSCASISSGSSDRNHVSNGSTYVPPTAHTPVERYVPQPPLEVLYPDRYVDRYVTSGAPTDRYVLSTDSGDSYIRRDLGFHHHYRLPPPAGYPYTHQSHFRFRGLTYQSPGHLGGSPGSSSSSSSTSAQRDSFSTSPLLRSKVRVSPGDFGANATSANTPRHVTSQQQQQQQQQSACCIDVAPGQRTTCCQPIRRSIPPGALPSIPQQTAHSSWQPSPNSTTTSVSSNGPENDSASASVVGMYPTDQQQQQLTATESSVMTPTTSSTASTTTCAASTPNITRSVSAPAGSRPQLPTTSSVATSVSQRPRLRRNQSRTEAFKNYIKRETATFFGVDEESEAAEKQKWLDRRRRMASRKYGALLPEYKPTDPDITKDVPDSMEVSDPVILRKWQRPVRRKDSVARMTLSGLQYMVDTLRRQRPTERPTTLGESRSFPPSVLHADEETATTDVGIEDEEEEAFFQAPLGLVSLAPPSSNSGQDNQLQLVVDHVEATVGADDADASESVSADVEEAAEGLSRIWSPPVMVSTDKQLAERASVDGQARRSRVTSTRDHYTLRSRAEPQSPPKPRHAIPSSVPMVDDEGLSPKAHTIFGGKRISTRTIDRVFDNSNRRQYGMGIVGRFFGRSFRKSVAQKPDVRKQLDDFEDHRPYFTYWITTVQVLILIISLACYGFGPVGLDLHHRSSLVLVTSLSLQQVEYQEPANFWLGPRASDLIHLGAKFAPCMRRDIKILKEIDVWREKERDTACCIRNDDSGCVQSSRAECSNTISTWKKWGPADSGPGGRISGSVCGLDPKFCDAPASIAPYEWPDDITKWPICRKINPFSQRFRSKEPNMHGNANFPVSRYKDKMAEHMVCEVIGHPCCIGIHGTCRITTKEYCDFVHGYFHEEASLCSQVECLHDVCGMIPFLNPEWPDQFYRLFTTTFLHAGILHITITIFVQYFLMRDLEKLTGSIRIALIYFTGALAGNLASAIFVPYRAEVGPAGAHFALLATLVVEVLHCWPMLKYPRRALTKLILILVGLLLLGVLPWVDNYAHLFGFIFGFLAAYALMPFISFGQYDRRRKIFIIWICLILILGLFGLLLALFYNVPMYECELCKLFNCVPFTRDFCASQNINFKREEPV